MDDLNLKLEEILNDPESMKQVRMMAESLLGDESSGENGNEQHENSDNPSFFDSADIGKIMGIVGKLQKKENDNRTKLLLALKPHLSPLRREKVDSAVKLLKLIEALPLLKEAGILNFG
ncbi:MAG: hypothetical protein J5659_00505 [Clostridia bacterium]|nr:hypothetical protein [Clostridia bacterium]